MALAESLERTEMLVTAQELWQLSGEGKKYELEK